MNLQYFTVDAFTTTPFAGAQVAVFPNAGGLSAGLMQKIAAEFNLSETVFLAPGDEHHSFRIHTYTPRAELNFGAHTIIAAAHVLSKTGAINLLEGHTPCRFILKDSFLDMHITGKPGEPELVQFSMQVAPVIDRFVPYDSELAGVLSLPEKAISHKPYRPYLVSEKQHYLIVPVTGFKYARAAIFDYKAWSQSTAPATMAQEILLITTQTENPSASFHARLLGPGIGINEDPPVGAAIPALAGYIAEHEHIKPGTYTFAVERGLNSARKSLLHLEFDKRKNRPLTLRVGGQAILMSEGILKTAQAA